MSTSYQRTPAPSLGPFSVLVFTLSNGETERFERGVLSVEPTPMRFVVQQPDGTFEAILAERVARYSILK